MAIRTDTWQKSRLEIARDVVKRISDVLPPESLIAVRDFTDELSLKMGSREIPLTVSRLIYEWAEAPFVGLSERLESVVPVHRPINLCTAVVGSSPRDFGVKEKLRQRIVIVTDGESRCLSSAVSEIATRRKQKRIGSVDVIALGMQPSAEETFSRLSEDTDGTFLDVAQPSQVQTSLAQYTPVLRVSKPVTVEVSGSSGVRRVLVGQKIQLPPGLYSLWLPGDLHLPQSEQKVGNIEVSAEKVTTVTLSRQNDRLNVRSTVNVHSEEDE